MTSMASPSTMCAKCLRAARRATTKSSTKPSNLFATSLRQYSITTAIRRRLYPDYRNRSLQNLAASARATHTPFRATLTSPLRRSLATTSDATSSSPSEPQLAHPILHPRTGPSGEPMRVSLSPRAAHRLSTIAATDSNPNLALRITIESGGCHGFQYFMSLTDLSTSPATEEDTVFEGDKGAKVVIDEASLELLNGSTVDYTMELIGSQFKVTGIPGATSSCGCGTSFDIKL